MPYVDLADFVVIKPCSSVRCLAEKVAERFELLVFAVLLLLLDSSSDRIFLLYFFLVP